MGSQKVLFNSDKKSNKLKVQHLQRSSVIFIFFLQENYQWRTKTFLFETFLLKSLNLFGCQQLYYLPCAYFRNKAITKGLRRDS